MKYLVTLAAALFLIACGDTTNPVGPPDHAPALGYRAKHAPVESRVFIHYRPGFEHKDRHKPRGDKTTESSCFSELARGAVWKNTEPYRTTFTLPVATWEFENDIFGPEEAGAVPSFNAFNEMDGLNTAQVGPYPDANVIAVTVVWGIFRGPPGGRELLEWDILMNTHFTFDDADADSTVMDTENIAVHELGHALGLGHPDNSCTEETMYAFSTEGETKKRTLEAGDIAGVQSLY